MTVIKRMYRIGIVVNLILLVLAWVFYRERSVFADISYHLFELTRTGTFAIQNFRFAAVVTQWIPLLGVKMGWSLDTLMQVYSLAFPLFYGFVYLMCGWLKQYKIGLAFLLMQLLLVTDTFYWIQSELPQGMALLILLCALLAHGMPGQIIPRILWILAILVITPSVAFAHPLLLFPAVFLFIFLLRKQHRENNIAVYLTALVFVAAIIIKKVYFATVYDAGAFGGLHNFKRYFPNYITQYANKRFLIFSAGRFLLMTAGGLFLIWVYLKEKRWLKLLLLASFFGGYLILVNVCFPDPWTPDFYMENMYLPLALFIAVALVADGLPLIKRRSVIYIAATVIVFSGTARIFRQHIPFTSRLNWMEQYLHAHGPEKILTGVSAETLKKLFAVWGTPYEFWLLSTTGTGNTASILISENPDAMKWILEQPASTFIPTWGIYPYSELPARYFRFSDTVSRYRYIPASEP